MTRPGYLRKFFNLKKKRLRLHSFGPFWTISTENQWEISEVGRLSCFIEFFVWFHIVCNRYTSDYAHFTFSDTIWPLLLPPNFGTQISTLAETVSYKSAMDVKWTIISILIKKKLFIFVFGQIENCVVEHWTLFSENYPLSIASWHWRLFLKFDGLKLNTWDLSGWKSISWWKKL